MDRLAAALARDDALAHRVAGLHEAIGGPDAIEAHAEWATSIQVSGPTRPSLQKSECPVGNRRSRCELPIAARAACPTVSDFAWGGRSERGWCPYRVGMSQFPESTSQDSSDSPSFLSLLGIAVALVTAGVSLAMLMAGG
jgi:hypothetical protein